MKRVVKALIYPSKYSLYKFALRKLYNSVFRINYWFNNYEEVVWLIGDGRSGTTWVADLINHRKKYREMFEPFHPKLVKSMSFLKPQQYIRPHDSNEPLEKVASDVFSGKFTHYRVDSANRAFLYDGLLIKDIFANLFSYWVSLRFPYLKIIFLIRNPFSVAVSKYKTKDWFWVTDPLDLLNQNELYEDYLQQFEDIITSTTRRCDYILNQILIWSIINYVPLRQFRPGQIHVVFYENVYIDPSNEISQIFRFVKPATGDHRIIIDSETGNRPSRVAGPKSNLLAGTSPITSWKNELSSKQIDAGFDILKCFGFGGLYDDNSMPNKKVFKSIHQMT